MAPLSETIVRKKPNWFQRMAVSTVGILPILTGMIAEIPANRMVRQTTGTDGTEVVHHVLNNNANIYVSQAAGKCVEKILSPSISRLNCENGTKINVERRQNMSLVPVVRRFFKDIGLTNIVDNPTKIKATLFNGKVISKTEHTSVFGKNWDNIKTYHPGSMVVNTGVARSSSVTTRSTLW